jgi:hypothetical protein
VTPEQIATEYGISVDEVRTRRLALRVALWKSDYVRFAKEVLRIRTKDGELEPLLLNEAQMLLHNAAEAQLKEERWVRLAGLKGRRQGFSTYVAGRGYWKATLWDRQRVYILSHEMASSTALFNMVSLMQEKNAFKPEVGTDNAKELEFIKRGSSYQVATAGQKAGGRGTAISFFHGSEAAWWTNAPDHFASSVQAVDEVRGVWGVLWQEPAKPLPFERGVGRIEGWVRPPSEIWLETTSAGPQGEFYKRYMAAVKGEGRYRHVFVPWTAQEEYIEYGDFTPGIEPEADGEPSEAEYQQMHGLSDERMLWRRSKIQELGDLSKFKQEFPIDVDEAFAAADVDGVFIKPALVMKARKRELDLPDAPLIIGIDPAGQGGDRFGAAFRRGDAIYKILKRQKLNHEEAVAWISSLIDEYQPNRVNIDNGSMGQNIVTTLRNMKPKYAEVIRGVNFGGTSRAKQANKNRAGPVNRRAEMYQNLRTWLEEGGSIPDDADLSSDLSAAMTKWKQNNDWLLESKSEMKARGIRSPDLSDACALTFAAVEWFDSWSSPGKVAGFSAGSEAGVILRDMTKQDTHTPFTGGSPYSWMA